MIPIPTLPLGYQPSTTPSTSSVAVKVGTIACANRSKRALAVRRNSTPNRGPSENPTPVKLLGAPSMAESWPLSGRKA